jgi:hypothetical protein
MAFALRSKFCKFWSLEISEGMEVSWLWETVKSIKLVIFIKSVGNDVKLINKNRINQNQMERERERKKDTNQHKEENEWECGPVSGEVQNLKVGKFAKVWWQCLQSIRTEVNSRQTFQFFAFYWEKIKLSQNILSCTILIENKQLTGCCCYCSCSCSSCCYLLEILWFCCRQEGVLEVIWV